MAPQRKQRQSHHSPMDATIPSTTPQRSPVKKRPLTITQGQKQALIDNLQLEITERARKLRAQYALQAQSLRTRVEIRVDRIPKNLRAALMGDLLLKYAESAKREAQVIAKPAAKPEAKNATRKKITTEEIGAALPITAARARGVKRTSDIMIAADKENAPDAAHVIPNPKKRTKITAAMPSRQVTNPSCVLSPKSSNSRTLTQSPIRPPYNSPPKSLLSRPVTSSRPLSPIKMTSPAKAAAFAATGALADLVGEKLKPGQVPAGPGRKTSKPVMEPKIAATRARRGGATQPAATGTRTVSNSSNTSGTSTGTTVVKTTLKPLPASRTAAKKGVAVSAAGKKVVAGKPEAVATGQRVLRKRG